MIIQLRDRQEIYATKQEAEQVKEAINRGVIGIEIHDEWFRADYVVRIKNGGDLQKEVNDKQIEAPDYRGKPSESKEKLRQMLKERKSIKNCGQKV